LIVCTASGTCESLAHSDLEETVALQYGLRRKSSAELTAAEVTTEYSPATPSLSVVSATTAEPDSKDGSTRTSVQCTNWTDIEQFRFTFRQVSTPALFITDTEMC